MTQIISRMYASRERAAEAVKALKDYGFSDLDIYSVLAPAPADDLVTSIMKCRIARSRAEVL